MGETASEKYVSFQNDLIEHKPSHKIFDWILNYPFFNESRNNNLTQPFNNANLNDESGIENSNEHASLKNAHINNAEIYLKRENKELTTTLIKKELNKDNYSVIHNSKFYVSIIKKSEKMYKVYNDNLREEERKKKKI